MDRPCGFCDNCEAGIAAEPSDDYPFALNSRVNHSTWGEGQVLRYEGDKLFMLFDEVGYKTPAVPVVVEQKLLTPYKNFLLDVNRDNLVPKLSLGTIKVGVGLAPTPITKF